MTHDFAPIHDIVSHSNRFWRAMYFDGLEQLDGFEASHLENSDRLFYNAAQNIKTLSPATLKAIESYFTVRNITPGVYLDPASPENAARVLNDNGYTLEESEDEHWYGYKIDPQGKKSGFTPAVPVEITEFNPLTDANRLDQFMAVNASVNNLPADIAEKLRARLAAANDGVAIRLFLATHDGKPVTTRALGIVGNLSFTAEGATLPEYRRKGIYLAITDAVIDSARRHGCAAAYVNCDKEAHSNTAALRYGFSKLFTRRYYLKKEG